MSIGKAKRGSPTIAQALGAEVCAARESSMARNILNHAAALASQQGKRDFAGDY